MSLWTLKVRQAGRVYTVAAPPSGTTYTFTTPGNNYWTCPAGLHSINITTLIGGGGGGGGGGGFLNLWSGAQGGDGMSGKIVLTIP